MKPRPTYTCPAPCKHAGAPVKAYVWRNERDGFKGAYCSQACAEGKGASA